MGEEKRKDHYVQFPLCLMMQIYDNAKRGLNLICDFGTVYYAKSFRYSIVEVARQLMYTYYRKRDLLQGSLYVTLNRHIASGSLSVDEDYSGFSGSEFDPLEVSTELLDLFESDSKFKSDAILNYQIQQAISSLNIRLGSIDTTLEKYNDGLTFQKEFESKFGPDSMPMVKITQLFEFRDSDNDLDIFRAYIAIKSIIGQQKFIESSKAAILSRMIGCKSKEAFEFYTTNKYGKNKNLLPTVKKYSKKYHMDILIHTLAYKKFIMYLAQKGKNFIYFSKYMDPEELRTLIIKTKLENNLKQRIKEASKGI